MKFDKNLAPIHAYLCADGYVIRNPSTQKQKYYHIGFRNTNIVLLKDFQNKFEKYFGIKPRLIIGERCIIQNKEIYFKLIDEFKSFYSAEWKMPELNLELSKKWLRTFFDCEGWVVCKSHQNRHIGLDSINEGGLNQVKNALRKLNINSLAKKRNDREIFSLKIYGKENLIKFHNEIGFLHPSKKQKLEMVKKDFVNYIWNFPNKGLKKFLKELINKKGKVRGKGGIIATISNKKENLIRLQKELNSLFNIESRVNKRINGIGTRYYELNINKRNEIKKLIKNNLLNEEEKEKWLKLKK